MECENIDLGDLVSVLGEMPLGFFQEHTIVLNAYYAAVTPQLNFS